MAKASLKRLSAFPSSDSRETAMPLQIRLTLIIVILCLTASPPFSQTPELHVLTGHSDIIASVVFSPDSKILASGGVDNSIKLWDVASGQELMTLTGHSFGVASVAFSPDGKILVSGSADKTIKFWDVASGRELRTLTGHATGVRSVSFTPDGRILASGSLDRTIKFWDVASGQELRTLTGHSSWVTSVAFSPDGKILASSSRDKTIKLWEVASGRELRSFTGHSESVASVAFSPDGRLLASSSLDKTIKLWDLASGRELRTLSGYSLWVASVAFSPDSRILAISNSSNTSAPPIRLWDVGSGQELKTLTGHSSVVDSLAFSHDGKILASGSADKTIKLWDVASGQELKTLTGHSSVVRSVAFSPDGKRLASNSWDKAIKLWNIASGQELRTLTGHSSVVNSVGFSPDGKILASGSGDKTIKLWDVASGRQLRTLTGHLTGVALVAFSPDGRLASSSYDIKLWDVASGREIRTLAGHSSGVLSLAFSPDGKILATGGFDKTIKLWDIASGQELKTLTQKSFVNSVAFSPDGELLASSSPDIKLWDVASGREVRTLTGQTGVLSVSFSPDGRQLASGGWDKMIKLWDIASGQELRTLTHSSSVRSVAFSQDGKMLVSGSGDGKINLWDLGSGSNLASLIALDERDWTVVTPDGLFDGSPPAWNKIIWRFNNNIFDHLPVEAFFNEFYYPGLLTDIFVSKRPKAPSDISLKDRRQVPVTLKTTGMQEPSKPVASRTVTLQVQVEEAPATLDVSDKRKQLSPSGVRDVRLFRNGLLVKLWPADLFVLGEKDGCKLVPRSVPQSPRRSICAVTVPIMAGPNNFTVYAFNYDNIKSEDARLIITGAENLRRQGTAYVLAVGVNSYANSEYDLKYAAEDAKAFGEEFRQQQLKLGRFANVEVIQLVNRDATKANILIALKRLAGSDSKSLPPGTPTMLQGLHAAQPEDAVVVYFAGHGTAQHDQFFVVPHDLGYQGSRIQLDGSALSTILTHSISDRELEQAFEQIDAGQILFIIDACNSGQALEAEEKRRGPMNSKGLAQLAYEKGMYILTAAQSYQAALETPQRGHGYLTYALVEEGLKTSRADVDPDDGQVTVREWLDHATQRVPQLQEEDASRPEENAPTTQEQTVQQNPSQRVSRRQRTRQNAFKRQQQESEKMRQLQREKGQPPAPGALEEKLVQQPRVFYRREVEPLPLIVAKPHRR